MKSHPVEMLNKAIIIIIIFIPYRLRQDIRPGL